MTQPTNDASRGEGKKGPYARVTDNSASIMGQGWRLSWAGGFEVFNDSQESLANEFADKMNRAYAAGIADLAPALTAAREALEFYANSGAYADGLRGEDSPINADSGQFARHALALLSPTCKGGPGPTP